MCLALVAGTEMGADIESRPKVIVLPAIQKQTPSLIIKIFGLGRIQKVFPEKICQPT